MSSPKTAYHLHVPEPVLYDGFHLIHPATNDLATEQQTIWPWLPMFELVR
jgi:hypothetical protein